jgi:hypothetical protein
MSEEGNSSHPTSGAQIIIEKEKKGEVTNSHETEVHEMVLNKAQENGGKLQVHFSNLEKMDVETRKMVELATPSISKDPPVVQGPSKRKLPGVEICKDSTLLKLGPNRKKYPTLKDLQKKDWDLNVKTGTSKFSQSNLSVPIKGNAIKNRKRKKGWVVVNYTKAQAEGDREFDRNTPSQCMINNVFGKATTNGEGLMPDIRNDMQRMVILAKGPQGTIEMLIDSGADYSVISEIHWNKYFGIPMTEWKGLEIGTIHQGFSIVGEGLCNFQSNELEMEARFCIVSAEFERDFYLVSDCSGIAAGVMLAQIWDGYEHPVAFASKVLKIEQRKWHPYEQETFACLFGLRTFHHYLAYGKFYFVTDCRALAHFNTTREVSPKVTRWLGELATHSKSRFIHRPGVRLPIPDGLSRDERFQEGEPAEKTPIRSFPDKFFETATLSEIKDAMEIGRFPFMVAGNSTSINTVTSVKAESLIARVVTAQKKDKFCKEIVGFFREGVNPDQEQEIKIFLKKIQGLYASGGVVFKVPQCGERHAPLPYVPTNILRNQIMRDYHEDIRNGHPGAQRLKAKIMIDFWWASMKIDVEKFCSSCFLCKANKPQKSLVVPLQPIELMGPWEFLSLDHVGPFPRTQGGYTHVLVIIDRFTRWVELCCIKGKIGEEKGDLNAKTTAKKILKRIVFRYGVPLKVLTDGGTSFRGEFDKCLQDHKIEHVRGNAYKHNTNGMAERVMRVIEEMLRHYVNTDKNNWDDLIMSCHLAINTSLGWGPKMSPYFLNFGREADSGNQVTKLRDMDDTMGENLAEESVRREELRLTSWKEAEANNRESQEDMIQLSPRTRFDKLEIGQWVMVKRTKETLGGKLESRNTGPWEVMNIDSRNNCNLRSAGGGETQNGIHVTKMSRYIGKIPEVQEFVPSQYIDMKAILRDMPKEKAQRKWVVDMTIHLQEIAPDRKTGINPACLIKQRIEVFWTQQKARGWFKGTIVGYNTESKTFSIEYDIASEDGNRIYSESLLSTRMPVWRFLK